MICYVRERGRSGLVSPLQSAMGVVRCAVVLLCVASACAVVDQLFRARCSAKCANYPKNTRNKCESECCLLTRTKPGRCPKSSEFYWYEQSCLKTCSHDMDCPETEKCCLNKCDNATTCSHAVDLDLVSGLPEVPHNLTVTDKQNAKLVHWAAAETDEPVFYVVQVRRSAGQQQNFEPWKTRMRRRKNSLRLPNLTPAHWYQVRVAAINANGSRGYSEPCSPFKLRIAPSRPDEPQNVTVVKSGWVDGYLRVELQWKRPKSDLPLKHYRVFWSHCVMTDDVPTKPCKDKSVIRERTTLNYTRTSFVLDKLEPNALYFIQVQAITIPYESKKLSSEKAAIFINTRNYKNATYDWLLKPKHTIKKLKVISYYRDAPDKLEAQLSWESVPGRFLVTWAPQGACAAKLNNATYEATTQDLIYTLDHLAFNCKYQIIVKAMSSSKTAKINIKTPLCSQLASKKPCL